MINDRMSIFDAYLNKGNLTHHEYQKDGVRWILSNELKEDPIAGVSGVVRGGFIADEMGLGKTIMMIGAMLANFVERTLIIVPPALVDQWYVQIARTTGHKSLIFHGNQKKKITHNMLLHAKIVITTYGAISRGCVLHNIHWSRLIFDEAHHLRNANTALYKGAHMLKASIRWLVSGTPIQNRKQDFYNLCRMIGLPASYYTESENLMPLTRAFIMKRTKKQVGIIIPELIEQTHMVAWANEREKELSEELHSVLHFSSVLNKGDKQSDNGLPFAGTLPAILKARQACILPRLLSSKRGYSDYKEAFKCSSKLDYAVGKMLERKGNGAGKLIFCHFREEIDEIATRLRVGGMVNVATFDGRTGEVERREILSKGYEALVMQIQTGCEGLNLQEHYSEIYFISPHWNPAIEDQAVARCHRIGQTKVVYVERFEMCAFEEEDINIEKYIYLAQRNKMEISSSLIAN